MTPPELVTMGREWLEHSPQANAGADGLAGWSGAAGFVCACCATRILMRGCNLRMLADTPVWGDAPACSLCED